MEEIIIEDTGYYIETELVNFCHDIVLRGFFWI